LKQITYQGHKLKLPHKNALALSLEAKSKHFDFDANG